MKRFDYLCILYSIALLAFGFDDKTPIRRTQSEHIQPAVHHDIPVKNTPPADKLLLAKAGMISPISSMKRLR